MEARNNKWQVRELNKWTQEEVMKDDLLDYIINKIWKNTLDLYSPAADLITIEPKEEIKNKLNF